MENFPNKVTRASIRLAQALDGAGLDEMRETLQWLQQEGRNPQQCYCVRDTFKHIAKLLRRDIRRG